MKNIHVLPTDKPSRLYLTTKEYIFEKEYSLSTNECQNKHIYITNDEEIKEGDWYWLEKIGKRGSESGAYKSAGLKASKLNTLASNCKKVILTTDQDLITDGVQTIDDDFLEWFVKNPSCEEVAVEEEDYSQKCKECGETVKRGCSCKKGCFMKAGNFIPTDENIKYKIIIPKEEPTFVDKLKEYFENTSEEKIQKDWDETCEKTKGINSPTVEEFLEAQKQHLINMMQDDEELGLYDIENDWDKILEEYYDQPKLNFISLNKWLKENYEIPKKKMGTKQETLEEAGFAYSKTVSQNHTSHMLGFLNGAKSDAAKDYWFKIFKEQFKKK